MPLPSATGSEETWTEWVRSLRPTTSVPDTISLRDLPLRVRCATSLWPDGDTIPELKVVQPHDWNFVAISHRWLENLEWEAYRRPYPAENLGMKVTAVSKKSLYLLASICRTMGFQYFWLDCICIDQGSALEKAREVVNMGSYYTKSARTVIFPYGIDKVGPPLMSDGSLPVWHSRAWTVQEGPLSGILVKGNRLDSTMTGQDTKVLYAVYMGD